MWLWMSIAWGLELPQKTVYTHLDNGLQVLIVPMDTELVSIQTWIKVGSGDELSEGQSGYAHFFEHLMFHGTETWSREKRQSTLLELGAEENAWTSSDYTCYHLLAPAQSASEILQIEADRFQNLTLSPEGVRREAGAVLGEYRKGRSNVNTTSYEALLNMLYKKHPYQHSTIGYERDVLNMPEGFEQATAFYKQHYQPEKTTLVVVGGVDPKGLKTHIEDLYKGWVGPESIQVIDLKEPLQKKARRKDLYLTQGEHSNQLRIAYPIPFIRNGAPEVYALSIIAEFISDPSGPLMQELVMKESAPLVNLWVDSDVRRSTGMFVIGATLSEEAEPEFVENRILEALDEIGRLSEADVSRYAQSLRRQWLLRLESPDVWASRLGRHLSSGQSLESWASYPEGYTDVSLETVYQTADDIFLPAHQNTLLVLGEKK